MYVYCIIITYVNIPLYITLINLVLNQAIEFFFFAGVIFVVAIIFGIMSFFYKYVDLSNRDISQDSAYNSKSHDESSALISSSSKPLTEPVLD